MFNKKGYAGTSLSDLTEATGLTKGAIYGNFKNKEALAVEAFKFNVRAIMNEISIQTNKEKRAIDKLYAITNYYRGYYDLTKISGGCPILNVGADTKHINPVLFRLVKSIARKLEGSIAEIISKGIKNGEFRNDLDAKKSARNIYSMMEGSVFMASTHDNRIYLINMMDHIDEMIRFKMLA
ncbi:MAG: TetR/AcrR family transcriptional regulator [Balneolaceae bacterium]